MKVRQLSEEDAPLLERFVATHPHGSIEQTWEWGELQCSLKGREGFFVLGAFENPKNKDGSGGEEKLIASILLIRQTARKGKTWLWGPRGPLLPLDKKGDIYGVKASHACQEMKDRIASLAKNSGDIFMRVEPGIPTDDPYELGGNVSNDSYLPAYSLIIDLAKGPEAVLKQMKQKGRYNIKRAEKAGVYVQRSTGEDFDEFYELLEETGQRDGFHVHPKEFYGELLDELEEKACLYLAYKDHQLLGGMIVTYLGDTATYYFGASANQSGTSMAPYALQWFAIQEAIKKGCTRYDFLGVAAFSLSKDGKPSFEKGDRLAGVTQFKTRFGGHPVAYKKARVFIYRWGWWLLYKFAKMLRSSKLR